ncbi:hypothetical protein AURDEDRAFT_176597 [Auricularia subglabra TFB-10046 SS5]|uniref:Uncharacterized protein n=1 Tax=Auricularia subglabra (strain TFB-10046 / SS5) TaxID=717982 RepID=J0CVC3_AURST|nr:hypothetical protein AURDEDRAFT_176597 [Auricularia subglabra TFB-10046 SS5]
MTGCVVVTTVEGDLIREFGRLRVSYIESPSFLEEVILSNRLVSLTIPLAVGFRTLCEQAYFLPKLTTLRLLLNALPDPVAGWSTRALVCPKLSSLILQREVEDADAYISLPVLKAFTRMVIARDVTEVVEVVLEDIRLVEDDPCDLLSLEIQAEDCDEQCWLAILHQQATIRELFIWGTFAIPPGILPRLSSFTGNLRTALSANVSDVVASLHGISSSLRSLLLRPSVGVPEEYLPILRNNFPLLQKLTLTGFAPDYLHLIACGKEVFPPWASLREVRFCCGINEQTPLDVSGATQKLLAANKFLTAVDVQFVLAYDLCLDHIF